VGLNGRIGEPLGGKKGLKTGAKQPDATAKLEASGGPLENATGRNTAHLRKRDKRMHHNLPRECSGGTKERCSTGEKRSRLRAVREEYKTDAKREQTLTMN